MQPLDAIFSPPEQRLLATVLGHPDKDYGTVELLSKMGSSRGSGSTLLQRWVDSGLLKEKRVGNQRRLTANPQFLLYPELRKMAMKTVGLAQPLAQALSPLAGMLEEAFVFGSVAAGKDTSVSDIDLAIIGDVDLFAVSPLLDPVEQELGRPVHVNIYSSEEWSSESDPVVRAIKTCPRIDLMGELRGSTR